MAATAASASVAPCGLRRAPLPARRRCQQPTLHSCLGLPQRVCRRRAQVSAHLEDGTERHEDAHRGGVLRSDNSLETTLSVAPLLAGQSGRMLSLAGWLTLLAAGGVAVGRADAEEAAATVEEWQSLTDSLIEELGAAPGVESTTGSSTLSEGVPSTDSAAEAVRTAESTIFDSIQNSKSGSVDADAASSLGLQLAEQTSKLQDSAANTLQAATDVVTPAGSTTDAAPSSVENASQVAGTVSDMLQSVKDSALDGSSVDAASSSEGPSFSERASQFFNSATDAIQSAKDSISEQFSNGAATSAAVEGSDNSDAVPTLAESASQLAGSMSDTLQSTKDSALEGSSVETASSASPSLSERASQFFNSATDVFQSAKDSITEQFSNAPKEVAAEGSNNTDAASSAASSLTERASQLLDSTSPTDSLTDKLSNAAKSASDSASSLPSAPVEPSMSSTLSNAAEKAASSAAESASTAVESARSAVESATPSATPDLSSVLEQYRRLRQSSPAVAPPQQPSTSFEAPKFNFSNPIEAAQEAGKSISETLSNLPGSLKSGLEGVRDGIKGTLSGVKPPVSVPEIKSLVPSADGLTQNLQGLTLISPTAAANDALVQVKGSLRSVAGEAASTVSKGAVEAVSTLSKGVGVAASAASSVAGQVLTTAGGVITEKAGQLSVELHKLPAEYQPAVQVLETGASYVALGVSVASDKVSEVVAALAANPQSPMIFTIFGLGAVTVVIVSAVKDRLGNYAGEMIAAQKAYELVKDQGAVLIDLRTEQERRSKGIPDFKRGARSRLRFVQEEPLERSQRKKFTNPDDVELQILAEKILGQTGVAPWTPLVLMDADGRVSMQVAATVLGAGAQRVYRMAGGFESGWIPSGLPIRPDENLPALQVLKEDAEEVVQETVQVVKQSPQKVFLPLLGVAGSAYTIYNYEYVLQYIGVLAIFQLIYKKLSSYDSPDDFYRDIVRLIVSVSSLPNRLTKSTSKAAKALQEYQKLPEQLPAGAPTPKKTEFEVATSEPKAAAPKAESNAS